MVDELPDDVELWAVQYPGREDRFGEPHPRTWASRCPSRSPR
ncbi:hypothetical protein [Saccharothrix yanglingensis]|nr:hypothetical protein [Saccharothrix yanglingensis]